MKNLVLFSFFSLIVFSMNAQTKGTNAIGFGFQHHTTKTTYGEAEQPDQKYSNYALSYGNFIKDNAKLSFTFDYGKQKSGSHTASDLYGGSIGYYQYYPLLKKFYAFAGGDVSFYYTKGDSKESETSQYEYTSYSGRIGAEGGVSYFLSRHLAFEVSLLSAGFGYQKSKTTPLSGSYNATYYESTNTSFDVSSSGVINDLAFKIYFLF